MSLHALMSASTSLLELYVEQVFPIPLATWTPEVIQQEDGPESFELFISSSLQYRALAIFDDWYEYCGPMDFTKDIVRTATKADIALYRRFIVPDWALSGAEPWVYENRMAWVSPFHFYNWKLSNYSQIQIHPIHHNFVPEDCPTRMGTGDLYPKYGVWFYLRDFTSSFPLVIPMSIAGLPVDFCPTDFEGGTIVSYSILPNFVHYLSSFTRQTPPGLVADVSDFIDYYTRLQPAFVVPAGTRFTKTYVECGGYSDVAEGFGAQTCGNGLAPISGDPMIPLEYMTMDVLKLPGVKWVVECVYEQTMTKWYHHEQYCHFSF